MKIKLSCEVDSNVLVEFLNTLKNQENFTLDSFIEEKMKEYIDFPEEDSDGKISGEDFIKLLMEKTKNYKVGQLANIVLRKLLELGVANSKEIEEMQKASGTVPVETYHTNYGFYCKNNFNTSFPVLITEYQKENYDGCSSPPKFLAQPLAIEDKKFYLSAQWYTQNLDPMKTWIVEHLRSWLYQADEHQENELKKLINCL